jgi:trigger factor
VKVSTEQLEDRQAILTIEVEPERVQKFLQRGARELSAKVRIPGFRQGKAPYQMVVAAVGKDAIYQKILPDLVNEVYGEAIEQVGLEPVAQPEIEDVQLDPTIVRVRVPLAPEVQPGNYTAIRVEVEPVEVTDDAIDKIIEDLRQGRAAQTEVERAVRYDDLLTVDITGTAGAETVIDQKEWQIIPAQDAEAELWPGFDAAFIGMLPGETREFTLPYPADSASRWAGKDGHFVVTLKKVTDRQLPELNDSFASAVGDFTTLDALRQNIREGLQAEREVTVRSRHLDRVIAALIEGAETVKYPPVLLEQELDQLLSDQERQLQQRKINLDDYLKINRTTREQHREQMRPLAQQRLIRNLLLGAVAEAEKLTVMPDEIAAEVERIVRSADQQAQGDLRQLLQGQGGRMMILNNLLSEKTFGRLLQIARGEAVVEPAVTTEETVPAAEPAAETPVEDAESV